MPITLILRFGSTGKSPSPFLHRAYWRQRSDPSFVDYAWRNGFLENEVGLILSGTSFYLYRGPLAYSPDWSCPLPGHGGLFDSDNNPIDPADYDESQLDWRGIPKIGSHADDAKYTKGLFGMLLESLITILKRLFGLNRH